MWLFDFVLLLFLVFFRYDSSWLKLSWLFFVVKNNNKERQQSEIIRVQNMYGNFLIVDLDFFVVIAVALLLLLVCVCV